MPHRRAQAGWVDVVVGFNVRNKRIAKHMGREQVAEEIGISVDMLTACEAGIVRFRASQLYQLSRIFGVCVSDFFDDIDLIALKETKPAHLKLV